MALDPPIDADCIYYKLGLTSEKSALAKEERAEFCQNEMIDIKHGGVATLDGEFKNSNWSILSIPKFCDTII